MASYVIERILLQSDTTHHASVSEFAVTPHTPTTAWATPLPDAVPVAETRLLIAGPPTYGYVNDWGAAFSLGIRSL